MLTVGLRRGEALGVRLTDLDLDEARLGLRVGVKRVKARDGEGGTRTKIVLATSRPRGRAALSS
jgi:hypothetical protein